MARKANQQGTIRLKADGRWEAAISIAGHRYWLKGKTQAEVHSKLEDLKREHHLGQLVPPQRLTLAEYLDQWLEAGQVDWTPKTTYGYTSIVQNYWKPELGHVQVQKLTPAMIASCYARWRKSKSGGTLLNVHRCLRRALTLAARWGYVARNVVDLVEPPKAKRRKPELWSREQAAQFLAGTQGDRWGALWAILLGTGCRLGEAVALRWSDLDLDKGVVSITRSLVWAGGTPVEGSPKTESGVRVLTLPSFSVAALREWRARQRTEYRNQGREWTTQERVVLLPSGASPAPWKCRNAFHQACRKLGLPIIRRHDCRHLAASLLIAEGVSLPAVSQRLGHSSPAVTASIYSHALKGGDQQAAQALQTALGDWLSKPRVTETDVA